VSKKNQIKVDKILSLVSFILGNRPDEFGLVPDREGWLSYKELLWAIHEEPGWSYVRQSHIHEILMGRGRTLFEWDENRIRALERRWELGLEEPSLSLPKILYVCVKTRAHAYVMEQGLKSDKHLVLSPTREMALRIGRRRDPKPVLLEVMTEPAQSEGVIFYSFGHLFLATEIPPGFISGPPVSGEADEKKQPEKHVSAPPDFLAGTFVLDAQRDPDRSRRFSGKKQRGWKEDARKLRRKKG
jgi:putative RNA 2'-phosphotransferase